MKEIRSGNEVALQPRLGSDCSAVSSYPVPNLPLLPDLEGLGHLQLQNFTGKLNDSGFTTRL